FTTWSSILTRGVTLPRNRRFPFVAGFSGSVALSMPLGLILGRPFRPFRRAISSRCSLTVCFRAATSPNSSTSRASSSGRLRSARLGGGGTSAKNRTESSRGKRKMPPCPHFCPCYADGLELVESPVIRWSASIRRVPHVDEREPATPPERRGVVARQAVDPARQAR